MCRFGHRWIAGRSAALAGLSFLLGGLACQTVPPALEYNFRGSTMGTTFSVKVVRAPISDELQNEIREAIQSQLDDVNAKMSTYRDDSELSRFNHSRQTTPFPVSAETLRVFQEAARISAATQGAFDITVGPLVNAWGFGPDERAAEPTAAELETLRSRVGWDRIEVDEAASAIRKKAPDIYCDLSAIAKGFAVDQVSETLSALGYVQHMVEVGGEVRTRGHNTAEKPWRIAIERPVAMKRELHRVLPLADLALATSGDYRNFVEREGVRLSHTIDPRSGYPVRHRLASVSVIDESCMRADGHSTALMALGEEGGFRFAVREDLAALFLVREESGGFSEKVTPAFESLFGGPSGEKSPS